LPPTITLFPGSPMARAPSAFRQQDVTRALRAAKAAGVEIVRVEIDPNGKIILVTTRETMERREENSWDRV
jgi:hypothetical protein